MQKEAVQVTELFARYKQTSDIALRNELLLHYSPLVRTIAHALRNAYSFRIDPDDIVHEGMLALLTALDSFDPARQVKFETYAGIRVRGAMIDYLRRQDWVPRQVRRASREIDEANAALTAELGRSPSTAELADAMSLPEEKLNKLLGDIAGAVTLSFEELLYENRFEAEGSVTDAWPAERRLLEKEKYAAVAASLSALTERERLVISLYYYEHLKFLDIAKVLGVSDSRVSQIHTKALLTLKARLESYIRD